uniref:Uncharacterized protein n=1 Tax=Meloidogyne hapla TaxID=6305 RepID=A0A1I8BWU8_MELHA
MLHNFIFLIILVVTPFISTTCCGSKKEEGGGGASKKSVRSSRRQNPKKQSSDSKLSGSKKKGDEKKEEKGKKKSSKEAVSNTTKSVFKSSFDGLQTAVTMEPGGGKKSTFPKMKHRKSSGKEEATAKSMSKPTTRSTTGVSFSKSTVAGAPSDMQSKAMVKTKVKGGISQKRFKTVEEKIAATKKMLAYTGRKGPPPGNAMGNVDNHIEKRAEGHLAVAFSPVHIFDTPAYRYTTRNPKAGHVAKINEAGNLLYLCDDVSKTKSASSSMSSKMKEAEVAKSEMGSIMEEANDVKKDETDTPDTKDDDEEESSGGSGD